MHVTPMWTINDFPAYSILSRWSTICRTTCPYCMMESNVCTLTNSHKQSWFDNHHKFLPPGHSFGRKKTVFRKNKIVTKMAPSILSSAEILKQIDDLGLMKVPDLGVDETNSHIAKTSGWKK